MPTTILDGETYESALRRRMQEEASFTPVSRVLKATDWALFAKQKDALFAAWANDHTEQADYLDGLLNWIDQMQDAAAVEYGINFIYGEEND